MIHTKKKHPPLAGSTWIMSAGNISRKRGNKEEEKVLNV